MTSDLQQAVGLEAVDRPQPGKPFSELELRAMALGAMAARKGEPCSVSGTTTARFFRRARELVFGVRPPNQLANPHLERLRQLSCAERHQSSHLATARARMVEELVRLESEGDPNRLIALLEQDRS